GTAKVDDSLSGFDFSADDSSRKFFAGFTFLKFLAVEGSYINLGSPEDSAGGTNVELKLTGYDVYGVGVLPLGKHLEIFAKLGYIFWDSSTDFTGVITSSDSDSGEDPAYGGGIAFRLTKHFDIRAEYERFEIKDIDKVEVSSVGAALRF